VAPCAKAPSDAHPSSPWLFTLIRTWRFVSRHGTDPSP